MKKSSKRIRFAAALFATTLAVSNTSPILRAEENYQFYGQALVDECGYYVKVLVTTDKEGHVLFVKDNGTESPKSSEHFWNIFSEKKDDFFAQYSDKTLAEVSELEVDGISGATRTSRAAHEAVKSALEQYKEEVVEEPSEKEEPTETHENEENQDNSDYEIDEYGVLKEYTGSDTIARIPEGVIELDEYCFSAADNLKKAIIPASVEYINPQSFLNCPSLTSFEVDEENAYFYSKDGVIYAKSGDDKTSKLVLVPCGLKGSYTIPDDVTVIGESAFYSTYLSEIIISKSVKSIDSAMIDHAIELEAINVDENNKYFSSVDGLLYNKTKDELILVPTGIKGDLHVADGVKTLGEGVFYSCVNLVSVTLPEGITEIPMLAFAGCTSLTNVDIPESVTSIGDRSFAGTGSLTSLTIPKNVSEFGQYVFANSTGMKNINVEEGSKHFYSIEGVLFTEDKKTLVQYPVGRSGDYTVPEGTKCIGMGSFFAANFVEKVIVPDSVDTFGNPDYPNPILGSIVFGYFDYPKNLVLVATKGSATETYAKEFEIPFEEFTKDNKITEDKKETKTNNNQVAVISSGNNSSSSTDSSASSTNVVEKVVIAESPVALSGSTPESNQVANTASKNVKSQAKAVKIVETTETSEEDTIEPELEAANDAVVEDVDTTNVQEEETPTAAETEIVAESSGSPLTAVLVVLGIAVVGAGAYVVINVRRKR